MIGYGSTGQYSISWFESLGSALVKMGPMPKHIAIILDGNRRYAKKMKLNSVTDGHKAGAAKMAHTVDMLLDLGIQEVTFYVFSIENFKRSQEEINGIMEILRVKTKITIQTRQNLQEKGLVLEYIGNLEDTPNPQLKSSIEKNMLYSRDCNTLKINIAFIYTGRNEITKGASYILQALHEGQISSIHVTEQLLQETFTLHPSHPVDIMIRTSGEMRLSDFVLWGCSEAHLEFVDGSWPEFQFWGLLAIIFRYQNQLLFRELKKNSEETTLKPKGRTFVDTLREQRWNEIISSNEFKN